MASEQGASTEITAEELRFNSIRYMLESVVSAAKILEEVKGCGDAEGNKKSRRELYDLVIKSLTEIVDELSASDYQLNLVALENTINTVSTTADDSGFSVAPPIEPGGSMILDNHHQAYGLWVPEDEWTIFGSEDRGVTLDTIAHALSNDGALVITAREMPVDEEARQREIESMQRILDLFVHDLKWWHASKDTDSRATESLRHRRYSEGCEAIEDLILRSRAIDRQLVVTAGEETIETTYFSKGAYDMLSPHNGEPVEPGESLIIDRTERVIHHYARMSSVYVGSLRRKIEVAVLAEALCNGAEIALEPIEESADE